MSGAPASCWLLCLQYVCFMMNRTALAALHWRTPFERLFGSTPDISMIYRFKFYDRVYFKRDESRGGDSFPSASNEMSGRFVGFSEHVGHQMTYKVLTDDTQKVIYRSSVKLAELDPNIRLHDPDPGGPADDVIPTSTNDLTVGSPPTDPDAHHDSAPSPVLPTDTSSPLMAIIDANDLIGRSYLSDPDEDGTRFHLCITEQLISDDQDVANDSNMIRFRACNDDDTYDEVLTYRQILDKLEHEDGEDDEWHFKSIDAHRGPLKPQDPDYRGSAWNLQISCENGEVTWEPLNIIAKSDPMSCAIYAKDNNLLGIPGWKRFARLARRQKKLLRLANQAKLQSYHLAPMYNFGVQVPRNHDQAMELDRRNGNNLWHEAEGCELGQIDEYQAFEDKGKGASALGHKKIRVIWFMM